MKKILVLCFLCVQALYGATPLESYLSYLDQIDFPNGDCQQGEIEVVIDLSEILKIEKIQQERLLKKGFSPDTAAEFSRVGIVSEDQYWIWLRDAVYFPGRIPGTYDRLIPRSRLIGSLPGVAVLPILPSGKIGLILTYRHATRSWELEIPRGGLEGKETVESAALRELKEETGLLAASVSFLGEIATDSGVHSPVVPVFLGIVEAQEVSDPEYSEAIKGVFFFTQEELKAAVLRGFIEVSVEGEMRCVPVRDPFLAFALLLAQWRQLL